MPLSRAACGDLPDLHGVRLAYSGHLALNILPGLEGFLRRGAALHLTTCNRDTVDDDLVSALVESGAQAHAWRGMPEEEYLRGIELALDWGPTHSCEMGADLTTAAHARAGAGAEISLRAALEATGSGIARLPGDPLYPIFNWDDLPIKEGLHNRHMVGITTWQTFFERTFLTLHGKHVVVVGYGLVGVGLAESARAFGAVVSVVEKDPGRRLQASYAGWDTGELRDLAPLADVVVTATGHPGVVDAETTTRLKPGCFLINVGHVDHEIDVDSLTPREEIIPHVEAYRRTDGSEIYLFAGGSMANLAAGHGDSLNAFDVTAALMIDGVGFIAALDASKWPAGVYELPRAVWSGTAARALEGN